ncbi:CPBP family intramembrane glutamic endopeptidase [Neisseria sp. Ec49-e6-T10]|uniref:CPBP family intramembrane glutamic endopeptidase n=1 Tax=Neisseria sp. Ec49-e6-T10 TaxID=3140744 RepID=UPI003EC12A20
MMSSKMNLIYRPFLFYFLVYLLSWSCWSFAAYYSYRPDNKVAMVVCALLGLLGPFIAAIMMIFISGDKRIIQDYRRRLFSVSSITWKSLLFIVSAILLTLIVATVISVLFGFSVEQFRFSSGFFAMLPVAIVAALLEELGWRTYGVDSLQSNKSMLSATLLFAVLWGIWHIPLFFINQTYQQGLYQLGWLYVVNFFVSIFPAAILANWFYYKSARSIPAGVFFHFMLVATAELFQTDPQTKWIITILLLAVCIRLIVVERSFFLNRID